MLSAEIISALIDYSGSNQALIVNIILLWERYMESSHLKRFYTNNMVSYIKGRMQAIWKQDPKANICA